MNPSSTGLFISRNWWKIAGVLLVFYSIIAGFLGQVPRLYILHETIRNLYFHVTMWFSMMFILGGRAWPIHRHAASDY
jgi:heme exporter protein C